MRSIINGETYGCTVEKVVFNSDLEFKPKMTLCSSRKSMSNANQLLSQLLFIARHKNLSILFITQNSSNLEVNVLRQADYLIMKPSSLLQEDFERKIIKEIYQSIGKGFIDHKHIVGLTYIHSDKFQGFTSNQLPSFWNTKVSKAFK